jgi:beta-lactamase regulating signal transducer with metallopeptidase domain
MNALSQALLWSPVQVTALAVVAITIGALAGRRRPAAGALVAAVALVSIVGLTAVAFAPWPRWEISWDRLPWSPASTAADTNAAGQAAEAAIELPRGAFDGLDQPIKGRSTAPHRPAQQSTQGLLERAWNAVSGGWLIVAAVLYLAGVAGMGVRIALGLLAVRGYRRHSHPITDRRLAELADVVCAELGCRQGIELRETTQLTTPATIGWLRPMLLLPADWRRWSDDEKHAVLAHEIEHVRRGDFACWIAAQLGVALHFYHPLVHWLANRLRLQQELAADAAAARALGGQRKYVTTLAAMALREADSPIAWPARAFLPNSKTFVRRIEMLHRSKPLRGDVSRPVLFLSVAAVVLAAVCAAGIRGSVAGEPNFGLSGEAAQNGASTSSTAVLALNQAEQPANLDEQHEALRLEAKIVMDRNYLKQLALAMYNYDDKNQHCPTAIVMGPDGKTSHSWRVELLPYLGQQALYQQYRLDEP